MSTSKKIYLAYRFTGEDVHDLKDTLGKIASALRSYGHTVYCSIEDEEWSKQNQKTNREILLHAFEHLDTCDLLVALVKSDQKSEGMLLEIGYMIAKGRPIALALQRGVKTTFLAELAEPLIEYDSIDELCTRLSELTVSHR